MTARLRIATRDSELALRRARGVQAMLAARNVESDIVPFRTAGDRNFEEPYNAGGSKTLFTRELEFALARKKADVAVHALSDMSTDAVEGLAIAAILPRDDPRDVLVLNELLEAESLADLPRGTRVGSSNIRCRSLLSALCPEVEVVQLRGDLPTRLRKVSDGQVHATIVSAAALHRLGVSQRIAAYLEPPEWLPAPGQGAVALQLRENDERTLEHVASLNDAGTAADTAAERAVLAALEGGLQSPLGALVMGSDGKRVIHAVIADLKGRQLLRAAHVVTDDPGLAGVRLANELRAMGASAILDAIRGAERLPTPQPDG